LLLFQVGDLDLSFTQTSACFDELCSLGTMNMVAVQLQTGLGALRGRQGRYEEAVVHLERAWQLAMSLGNDTLARASAANLALFYGRLGRFEDQLRCAEESLGDVDSEIASFTELQLTYSIAYAHGICGRAGKTRSAISDLEGRLGINRPGWIMQPWLLWKADALQVAGLPQEASRSAMEAILSYDFRLEASSFAGAFARWVALTHAGVHANCRAEAALRELENHLEEFDALDQAEILCANAHFRMPSTSGYEARITAKLRHLPASVATQLYRLGMSISVVRPEVRI